MGTVINTPHTSLIAFKIGPNQCVLCQWDGKQIQPVLRQYGRDMVLDWRMKHKLRILHAQFNSCSSVVQTAFYHSYYCFTLTPRICAICGKDYASLPTSALPFNECKCRP